MTKSRRVVYLAMLCLSFLSCGPQSGEVPVQVVAPSDQGMTKFGLCIVNLPRVIDLSHLKGERILFRAGKNVPWSDYSESVDAHDNFESARGAFFGKVPFEPAFLRLSWNGRFYQAIDFDSLYMLTAYYWLEQAWDFYADVVHDHSSATSAPVMVSVYGAFTSKGLVKVPTGFIDNSAYQPLEDMFKMYRVGDQDGLPFEMNPGVVAHEFQHRIFHHLVFQSNQKIGYSTWLDLTSTRETLKYSRARQILRATDEGIADINAVGFSRNSNFLAISHDQTDKKTDEPRNLDGPFANAATYDNLANGLLSGHLLSQCNGESINFTNPHFSYYCLGTVIAKTIWDAADRNVDILRREFLPSINQSLAPLGQKIIGKLDKYDMDIFWQELLTKLAPEKKSKLCAQIQTRFQSVFPRIQACS